MSVETLRDAAALMRHDYAASDDGTGCEERAWLAVADWLDTVARLHVDGDSGGPLLQGSALAVARTYLGEVGA